MGPGLLGDADRTHLELVLLYFAPVEPHLGAEDNVEGESEGEASGDDGVAYFGGGSEEAGEAAANLRDDGESGELAGALGAVVLPYLRQLGEKGEWERRELEERKRRRWRDDEGKEACKRGLNREDCALDRTSSLESGWRVIVNDEDGNDDVLDGEEEVLAIC